MAARFTSGEAAAIDDKRGDTDRSVWLRSAALAALSTGNPQTGTSPQQVAVNANPARPAGCSHRIPSGAYCKTCEQVRK
jgi:hypothetical protein